MSKNYAIRYLVEEWNKPSNGGVRLMPGITVSPDDHGYTDRLLVVSILYDGDEIDSALILDTKTKGPPDREIMEFLKEHIEHYLEHHCD